VGCLQGGVCKRGEERGALCQLLGDLLARFQGCSGPACLYKQGCALLQARPEQCQSLYPPPPIPTLPPPLPPPPPSSPVTVRVEVSQHPDIILDNATIKQLIGNKCDGVIGQLTEVRSVMWRESVRVWLPSVLNLSVLLHMPACPSPEATYVQIYMCMHRSHFCCAFQLPCPPPPTHTHKQTPAVGGGSAVHLL